MHHAWYMHVLFLTITITLTMTITPSASLVPLKEGQCIHRGAWLSSTLTLSLNSIHRGAWLSSTLTLSFLAKPTARQDTQISTSPDSG